MHDTMMSQTWVQNYTSKFDKNLQGFQTIEKEGKNFFW